MKNIKRILITGAVILTVGAASATALAATNNTTPAEIIAGLTGEPLESVITERTEMGKAYGTIAGEAGVLAEFQEQKLEQRKSILAQRVVAGTMTQESADAIVAAMEANLTNCDGTGNGGSGAKMGAGFGVMNGKLNGNQGEGSHNGLGTGACLRADQ